MSWQLVCKLLPNTALFFHTISALKPASYLTSQRVSMSFSLLDRPPSHHMQETCHQILRSPQGPLVILPLIHETCLRSLVLPPPGLCNASSILWFRSLVWRSVEASISQNPTFTGTDSLLFSSFAGDRLRSLPHLHKKLEIQRVGHTT